MMKAAVIYEHGAPDVLHYEDWPDPRPGPNQLLVKIEVISIEGGDHLEALAKLA